MGAIVLNGARIASGSVVAAGAIVPEGKEFPPRSLIMGVPAKVVRETTARDLELIAAGARHYQERARRYRADLGDDSSGVH
jgi:carbonic anhydrase/acetyltransferase-like protein (isoleucine patch superfamily)